jgi:ABC-type sugar transport system permease subunit
MTGSHKRLLFTGVLLIAILVNAMFWFATRQADSGSLLSETGIESNQLILASVLPNGDIAVTTRKNEVLLYGPDLVPKGSVAIDETVGAIAGEADGTLLVGTSKGMVTHYSSSLEANERVKVTGRVMAIAAAADGSGYYIAHGVGAFGVRFYLSYVSNGVTKPDFTYQISQPVTALVPWRDGVLFGTGNSQIGFFHKSVPDAPVWSTQLSAAISRIAVATTEETILVGDEKGAVTRVAADGKVTWSTKVGEYPVRGLNLDPDSSNVLVGDANGSLTVLGLDGSTVYQGTATGSTELESILATSDGWVAIPRSGAWQSLDPSAAQGATSVSNLRLGWLAANGLLTLLGAATAIAVVDSWSVSARRLLRRIWKARVAYVFILPAVGFIALFSYYPSVMAIYYSFTNYSLRSITQWIGFDNYRTILFDDPYFRVGIKNMFIITLTSVIKTLTIPLLIAELIFWLRNSWHSYVFRTLFILPTVVPGLVFTLMWRQIYDPDTGLINELLRVTGLGHLERAWLGNPQTALWAIIGVGFPWVDAFALLILLGGLLNINGDYFDAAKVDGASVWQRFRHVDLPLLVPQFRILLFFAIAGTIQGFVSIFILTRGGPGMTTYIPSLQMYNRISDGDFGYASAVGVILFLIILVATFIVLRFRRNDGVEAA